MTPAELSMAIPPASRSGEARVTPGWSSPLEYKGWLYSDGKRISTEEWVTVRAIRKGSTAIDEEVEIECGEEFLIITPSTGLSHAIGLAERLRTLIAAASFDTIARVTCSFGVCGFEGDENADALVSRADDLMYKARRSGRGSVVAE